MPWQQQRLRASTAATPWRGDDDENDDGSDENDSAAARNEAARREAMLRDQQMRLAREKRGNALHLQRHRQRVPPDQHCL